MLQAFLLMFFIYKDKKKIIRILKPAIYLYPTSKQKIEIIHDFKGTILNTYPKYNNKWTVIAEQTGLLTNLNDNRKYQYLFWDGAYKFPAEHYNYKSGFYINRENT